MPKGVLDPLEKILRAKVLKTLKTRGKLIELKILKL